MLELEGGCLARHLPCKLEHAGQPPHSLSQPQAPAHPGPTHPLPWSQKFLATHPIVAVFPAGQGTAQREKGSLLG